MDFKPSNIVIDAGRSIDARLLYHLGIPYTLITRDWLIHERMRYLVDWAVRLPGRLRVLDAGCGSGLSFVYLQHLCASKVSHYTGIDLDTGRLRQRHRSSIVPHEFIDADLDSPWRVGKFDLIFASEVIEHILDDRRLFANLFEHLSDDGVLVITTPNKPFVQRVARVLPGFDAISASQDGGHVRVGYDSDDLLKLAEEYPLTTISRSFLGRISIRELRRRDAMRKHSDFANTARFNASWLLRHALRREHAGVREDQYWSLAMAFQNCGKASSEVARTAFGFRR
jgi:SAM-dependent methyltransferase